MHGMRRTGTAGKMVFCFFAAAMFQMPSSMAQEKAPSTPDKAPSVEKSPGPVLEFDPEDPPLAIIQQDKGPFAPRMRAVVNFSRPGKACRPWHFEVAAHSDARIVFQIKEPTDHGIVLAGRVDEKAYQVLLGDSSCQFGVRIERIK
jgi:hypothetical protein